MRARGFSLLEVLVAFIIVALVVAWLLVLVPVIARRRQEVAKTADSALAARIVHSGARAKAEEECTMADKGEAGTTRAGKDDTDQHRGDHLDDLDGVDEELAEVAEAETSGNETALREEIGDLLFAVANLARKAGVDPEAALRDANAKFTRRFHYVEARCREEGIDPAAAGLERLDGYWNEVRAADKG